MTAAVTLRIPVARDRDGLHQAVLALFEESLHRHRAANAPASVQAVMEESLPERELADGYFRRASYLVELSNQLEIGITHPHSVMTQEDAVGVATVRQARAEYEAEHPSCPKCGERQDNRHTPVCHACSYQFRRGGR